MAEKNLNARIIHKHDIEANWLKATSFIPKQGEIIVYDIDANYNYERLKIGDGATVVSSLPFVNDSLKTILGTQIDKVDDKVDAVSALVGDTAVSEQINEAFQPMAEGLDQLISLMYGDDRLEDENTPSIRDIANDAILNSRSDWNQNNKEAIDYIKNRTHWVEGGGLEWDGNTEGLPTVNFGTPMYKISEIAPTPSDLIGGTISISGFGGVSITQEMIQTTELVGIVVHIVADNGSPAVIIFEDSFSNDGISFEKGTYFVHNSETYVSKLTAVTSIFGNEIYHKLDPRFLPDGGVGYDTSEILFDQTVEFVEAEGMMGYVSTSDVALEQATYVVTYNGVEYECTPSDPIGFGAPCVLGNIAVWGGDDSGEPFVIMIGDEEGDGIVDLTVVDLTGATTASVKIEKKGEIHKIDPKFLPETQSDWNQNNPNGAGYIKNRTHWTDVEQGYTTIVDNQSSLSSYHNYGFKFSVVASGVSSPLIEGNKYLVTFEGTDYPCVAYYADGYVSVGDSRLLEADTDINPMEAPFCLQYGEGWTEIIGDSMLMEDFLKVWDLSDGATSRTITIKEVTEVLTYHTIDEKFIPDSIARVTDINITIDSALSTTSTNPVQNKIVNAAIGNLSTLVGDKPVSEQINEALLSSQADWSQTDSTKPDYIKNKPDENDALELLMEMNLIDPVVAEDGSIYTDENGVMYTII